MSKNIVRRLLAVGAVVAVSAMTLGLGAGSAMAAASPLPTAGATGNLHIVKSQTPVSATQGDGTQLATAPPKPIQGVQFTIKQVNSIDLTTQAGWLAAGTLATSYNTAAPTTIPTAETAAKSGGTYTLSAGSSVTTDVNGQANFTTQPLGLYLVEETGTPAGVVPSAPFLVTLPMTDPSTATDGSALANWNYDVYVYPKNAVVNVTKQVTDATSHALGDAVNFTVNGDIPATTSGSATAPLDGYLIADTLDPALTYTGASATVAGTTVPTGDYSITTVPSPVVPGTATGFQIQFNAAGLALLGNNRGSKVVLTINTTANAVGVITNTANLYPSAAAVAQLISGTGTGNPPVVSNTVTTKWGGVPVLKQSQSGAVLSGATFQVYVTKSSTIKPVVGTDSPLNVSVTSSTGVVTKTSSWTTDATGKASINGLRYSDFANNAIVADNVTGYNYYWLVETKAPAGYELQAQPIGFTVESQLATAPTITVTDVLHNAGFALPFTGGSGTTVIYLVGFVVIAAAVLLLLVLAIRRRRSATTA